MKTHRWLLLIASLVTINVLAVLVSSVWHLAVAEERLASQSASTTPTETKPNEFSEPGTANTSENRREDDETNKLDPLKALVPPVDDPERTLPKVIEDPQQGSTANQDPQSKNPLPQALPTEDQIIAPDTFGASEIPSLASAEDLENDPVFQQFQSMFSHSQPPIAGESRDLGSAHFEQLQDRLSTVQKLTTATLAIAAEAEKAQTAGRTDRSQKLLRMTIQLREIASELLISDL